MIIRALVENTTRSEDFGSEHGLSLYIKTKAHKLLFDTGASALFAENAVKMDVDLSVVDLTVISHGHYDHGGGLETFLNINNKAKVYIHKQAFRKSYADGKDGEKRYIGLDESLLSNERLVFTGSQHIIDSELELFSGVKGRKLVPSGNRDLLINNGDVFVQDDFCHEQNLIINEDGNTVLIAGCAHNGIVNILEHFYADKGRMPDAVIGGFHLYNPSTKESESSEAVDEIGRFLLETKAKFYTCHCTGIASYNRLKAVMGDNIEYLSTGDQLII